jgi:glycosyltransferase involved in cell wall biosynthesis
MTAIMITVLIETLNDEVALAHALAALVPAATEGIVREVVVIDKGSTDGTLIVADAAGCSILDAGAVAGDPRRHAAERAKGDWLLFLAPSMTLAPGWQAEAMAFVDRAMVTGRGLTAVGRVDRGRLVSGWRSRLSGLWRWLSAGRPGGGLLVSKRAWLALSDPSRAFAASTVSGARRGAA